MTYSNAKSHVLKPVAFILMAPSASNGNAISKSDSDKFSGRMGKTRISKEKIRVIMRSDTNFEYDDGL